MNSFVVYVCTVKLYGDCFMKKEESCFLHVNDTLCELASKCLSPLTAKWEVTGNVRFIFGWAVENVIPDLKMLVWIMLYWISMSSHGVNGRHILWKLHLEKWGHTILGKTCVLILLLERVPITKMMNPLVNAYSIWDAKMEFKKTCRLLLQFEMFRCFLLYWKKYIFMKVIF